MTLFKKIHKPFILAALLLSSTIAQAITIGFDNITQSGNSVNVGVVISGLGSGEAPSVSTYDLVVNFDPTHLSYSDTTFGDSVLGNQLDVLDFGVNEQSATLDSSGNLNIFELSFDTAADLDDLQADSFTLATLTFDILKADTSPLEISINDLGDAAGDFLTADLTSATVNSVPVPPAFWLMASGIGVLYKNRKAGKSHAA